MGRVSALFIAFALGAACAVGLVACGSGNDADLLPGTTADQIESNLTRVEELSDEGDCVGAEEAVAEVTAEVEELRDVDPELKAALREGATQLSVAVGRCEEETTEETEPSLESDVGAEEVEEDEKPKKEKPKKDEEPSESTEEPAEPAEKPELPPQSEGNGEEKGGGEGAPPVQEEPEPVPPAGGVSPGRGVE